jgi:hypothetical protein
MLNCGGEHGLPVSLYSDVALNKAASLTQLILDLLEFFEASSANGDSSPLAAETSRTVCADT